MATPYERVEDAIKAAIVADDAQGNASPFRSDRVETYGGQLSAGELIEAIERMKGPTPAALVFYAGGRSNANVGQQCDETAEFHVVVVCSSVSRTQVLRHDQGLYALIDLVRSRCNFQMVPNQLTWMEHRRLPADWPVTAAAMVVVFTTDMWHQ